MKSEGCVRQVIPAAAELVVYTQEVPNITIAIVVKPTAT